MIFSEIDTFRKGSLVTVFSVESHRSSIRKMTYLCKWWIEFALIIAATSGFAHADVVVPENYAASTVAVGLTDGRDIICLLYTSPSPRD